MRAWIVFIGYTIVRLFYWVSGRSIWLSEKQSCYDGNEDEYAELSARDDCVPIDFRNDVVNDMRTTVRILCTSFVIGSVVLNLAIYRWR